MIVGSIVRLAGMKNMQNANTGTVGWEEADRWNKTWADKEVLILALDGQWALVCMKGTGQLSWERLAGAVLVKHKFHSGSVSHFSSNPPQATPSKVSSRKGIEEEEFEDDEED